MDRREKLIISMALGILSSLYDKYGNLTLLVIGAIVLDIITGILKAKVNREISSIDSFRGFWKKISLLAGLAFGFFLDLLVEYLIIVGAKKIFINVPYSIPIGAIIGVYIILNESISICENLHECGVKLPAFLINSLKITRKNIDEDNLKNKK